MPGNEALREFLRARRARLTPDEVGIPNGHKPRRVTGLRREEVAQLVDVSVDYYTRLEQGRVAPSDDILVRVGHALRLTADEQAHLVTLVRGTPGQGGADPYELRPQLRWILDAIPTPAFVLGRCLSIVGTNAAARRLLVDFDARPPATATTPAGFSSTRWPASVTSTGTPWPATTWRHCAARSASSPTDPELCALVEELSAASPEFAGWWSAHDVVQHRWGHKRYRHPEVGDITVTYEAFPVSGTDDQIFYVYGTEPGSASAAAMERLLT
ncbi:helix-turn-helix domain-containing protein [Asanoa sp. WMMD1127]|uniref:helix-turn-helix domain-containing protein n=1 Tax=Asanoa sp. WMMD1127 TaxID=3016107 RepID=UPI00241666F4|nr:helix-turn-helix domain-containing protein [Asanoa sp. WMMD1127]MDG4824338.1 helix-turn-helix domain-containing protein [Asanoa sp. WMMD1127]